VVLVAVRQHDATEAIAEPAQIRDVRVDDVDAKHLGVGEHDTAVDGDGGVLVFEHEEVEADLAETAERDHPERRRHRPWAAWHGAGARSSSRSRKLFTSAMCESRVRPATGIGAPTTTSMSPPLMRQSSRWRMARLPRTATGTIGTPVSMASTKP